MGYDSDSSKNSSNSSDDSEPNKHYRQHHHKKHKSEKKKHKKKSKKSKNHEHKRSSSKKGTKIGDEYNSQIISTKHENLTQKEHDHVDDQKGEIFGPILPPHLMKKTVSKPVIGPLMPDNEDLLKLKDSENKTTADCYVDDIPTEIYGPLPPKNNNEISTENVNSQELSENHLLLEQRALELKMAAIDGCFPVTGRSRDPQEREEWMMELPEVGLRRTASSAGAADILNLLKRGFHQGKEKPDFNDRSEWTKTPSGSKNNRPPKAESPSVALKKEAQNMATKRRDLEQEVLAKKYRRRDKDKSGKEKADESLLERHQRKLREKEKERKRKGPEKVERRPFNRDIDLKLCKIDSNQTKKIVKNAKLLDSKFASGEAKYL